MKQLTHFYHVYADGDWETPATEHFEELFMSGLIDELGDVFLGVVGSPENRRRVAMGLPGVVVAEADEGWEQLTLTAVHDYAKQNDAYVYYAHTKGAWSKSDLATEWRVSMTHDTVTRWQECVSQLRSVDAVGPFWLQSQQPEHQKHDFFFAGNFWWATTDYLAKLPELAYESRFSAEGWIGLGNPTVHVLREGPSYWGNFWKP